MNVLIIGANGFLGRFLQKELEFRGIRFSTLSRSGSVDYRVDISEENDFSFVPLNKYTCIINCATVLPGGSYLDKENLNKTYSTNILGTQNICNWIKGQSSINRVINCSSLSVVNKPWPLNLKEVRAGYPLGKHTLYSGSKLFQELIFSTFSEEFKLSLCNVRFSALYGCGMPEEGIIHSFLKQAKSKGVISLTNGNSVNTDFLHIKDAARVLCSLIVNPEEGILNAASGKEVSLLTLAEIIADYTSPEVVVRNVDLNPDLDRCVIDISKLKQVLNTNEFISLKSGILELFTLEQ